MAKRKTALEHLNSGREPHIVHLIPPGAPGYREADGGAMPASCSFTIAMICSSENLLRFIRPSPRETDSTQKWCQFRGARQRKTHSCTNNQYGPLSGGRSNLLHRPGLTPADEGPGLSFRPDTIPGQGQSQGVL